MSDEIDNFFDVDIADLHLYHPVTKQFVLQLRSLLSEQDYKQDPNYVNNSGLIYDFFTALIQLSPHGDWVALHKIYEMMEKCEFADHIEYRYDWRTTIWDFIQRNEKRGGFEIDPMMFQDSVAIKIPKDHLELLQPIREQFICRPYQSQSQIVDHNIILTDELDVDKYYSVLSRADMRIKPGVLAYDFYAALLRLYKCKGNDLISNQDFYNSLRQNSRGYRNDWQEKVVEFMKVLGIDNIAVCYSDEEDENFVAIQIIKPESLDVVKQNLDNLTKYDLKNTT